MREIKFRAWSKNQMLFRTLFDRNWYATPCNDENGSNCVQGIHPSDQSSMKIMQHTGLKDKNGKEIYEGDIYHHLSSGKKGAIEFDEGHFYCNAEGLTLYNLPNINNGEVIGNVYESPDLLNAEG